MVQAYLKYKTIIQSYDDIDYQDLVYHEGL